MASLYKRAGRYSLNWVEAGKRRRKSIGSVSEAEAEAALTGLERRIASLDRGNAGPTFDEWAIDYTKWHAEEYPDSYPRVEQILRCHLCPYFGLIPIGAITRQEVEGYKHARLGRVSVGTITKEMRTLQAVLNKAVDWEIIPVNRARGVKPPKDLTSRPPRWYTREELAAIYAADALHAHIWRLMVNTGLRRSEAQQLRRQDVGEDAIRVVSSPGARTKSAKWRLVPITPGARIALEGLLNEPCGVESRHAVAGNMPGESPGAEVSSAATGLVRLTAQGAAEQVPCAGVAPGHGSPFAAERGDQPAYGAFVIPRMTPYSITRAFSRAVGRVGLGGNLHCLRHTYCSHLVMAGVHLRTVQVLAGHSTILVTEKYAHLAPGHLQDATRGLIL